MKKIYLSILGIAMMSSSYAQTNFKAEKKELAITERKEIITSTVSEKTKKTVKAIGQSIFSSDFSNQLEWTTSTTDGNGAAGTGWNINATLESLYLADPIQSTSGGDFAELINGDPQNVGATHTLTTTNPIDITTNNLVLKFEQYGARWNDRQEVEISTDGSTWIKVGDNSEFANLTNVGGSRYDNPTVEEILLTSHVPSNATSLWVRFLWTSSFPDETDPVAWDPYGWMIDDVDVSTLADDDLAILNSKITAGPQTLEYSKIPLHQATALQFHSDLVNLGSNTKNDASLTVAITGGNSYNSAPAAMSSMDTLLFQSSEFELTETGIYNYIASAITNTDDKQNNNSISGSFEITNSEFTVEDGSNTGSFNGFVGINGPIKVGNMMDIFEDTKIDSMYVYISNNPDNVGKEFRGEVWRYSANNTPEGYRVLSETDFRTVETNDLGKNVKLALTNILTVSAGDDLLVMASHEGGTDPVQFGYAQYLPQGSVLGIETGNATFGIMNNRAFRVGLYLNKSASLIENMKNVSEATIYPNPTSGLTTLSYTLNTTSDVSVKMIDITGKLIYNTSIKNELVGNHDLNLNVSELKNGIYYVTISSNEEVVTKKLIKK